VTDDIVHRIGALTLPRQMSPTRSVPPSPTSAGQRQPWSWHATLNSNPGRCGPLSPGQSAGNRGQPRSQHQKHQSKWLGVQGSSSPTLSVNLWSSIHLSVAGEAQPASSWLCSMPHSRPDPTRAQWRQANVMALPSTAIWFCSRAKARWCVSQIQMLDSLRWTRRDA